VNDIEVSTDRWSDAYYASVRKIEAHASFLPLIREVAVAEQPNMPGLQRLRRNSCTFGSWVQRGMPRFDKNRRARLLAYRIALDLSDSEPGTTEFRGWEAAVYVTARNYVGARQLH
jgi:hypothetical protein